MDAVDILIFVFLFILILAVSVILNPPEKWVRHFTGGKKQGKDGDHDG